MRKILQCVITSNDTNKDATNIIGAINRAGFNGVFLQWYNKDLPLSQQEQFDLCQELGLDVEFVHLGYKGINNIWLEGEDGDALVSYYKNDLDACNKNGIKLVVMHITSKMIAPAPSIVGVKRLKEIADYADKLGIRIAFENTKLKGYLEYVFDNIQNQNIGICLDVGHSHCHFEDDFDFEKFKGKIWAVHLHDNHGKLEDDRASDEHLLPFDGDIDWEYYTRKLIESGYTGSVTLESHNKYYPNISLDEFYKLSYEKAKKLKEMFDDFTNEKK